MNEQDIMDNDNTHTVTPDDFDYREFQMFCKSLANLLPGVDELECYRHWKQRQEMLVMLTQIHD